MLHHLSIGVTNLEHSARFYDAVLEGAGSTRAGMRAKEQWTNPALQGMLRLRAARP
jgi:catechol 2,3-dioxygenase-like lactoylglutathione lyase family enzyme